MDIIDTCIATIKEEFPSAAGVWLFGSTASGDRTNASDIDLAILLSQKADSVKLWQCSQHIASQIHKDVDLVDLLEASTVFRAQIVQKGKLIYCADKFKCDMFEIQVLSSYLLLNEERKELMDDIKSRGQVFGNHG
jgi:uncharacterized protein